MMVALDIIYNPGMQIDLGGWFLVILGIGAICLTCILLFSYFRKKWGKGKESNALGKEEKKNDA